MYTRRLPPKLGALQRWVRECDATSGADGTPGDAEALRCLDLILRIANMAEGREGGDEPGQGIEIRRKDPWCAREDTGGEIKIWERMESGKLFGMYIILQHR